MIAKIVFFCASLAAVHSNAILYGPQLQSTGHSQSSRTQDELGNYAFSYEIVDEHGASNSRSEVGYANGNKQGSYSLKDTDGRSRQVDYIADEKGFRAVVRTNEPGTAKSNPASVVFDSPYETPAAPEEPAVEPTMEPTMEPTQEPAEEMFPAAETTPVPEDPVTHPMPVIVDPVAHPAPVFVAHPARLVFARPAPVFHPAFFPPRFGRMHGHVQKSHGFFLKPTH